MRQPPKKEGFFCVAVVSGAHGIRGDVVVKSFTDYPEDFANYGVLEDISGTPFSFAAIRHTSKGFLVKFSHVTDRNMAEALRGCYLYASADMLENPSEDEVYLDDVISYKVYRENGSFFGDVIGHFDNNAHIVLTIKHPEPGHKNILIPFTNEMITKIDHEKRMLIVTDFAEQMVDI